MTNNSPISKYLKIRDIYLIRFGLKKHIMIE